MQIGEVIRRHRKIKNLTQEEMANRLGVTAPAVNKWENGNSFPDIMLLAPIARLLNITVDTLLSFHEELTPEEIMNLVYEMDVMLKKESYEKVFQWAKQKIEIYPNCENLIWQFAVVLDVQRITKEVQEPEKYDEYILECYGRVLNSRDEEMRNHAADSLFGFYMRKEQYEKAEEYLQYFSIQNPERKRKQAMVYTKTGRIQEAYKTYEEILYADFMILMPVFQGMFDLALQEQDMERAHLLAEKQKDLARLLEMGKYYEVSCGLYLAVAEKDVENTRRIMEEMLSGIDEVGSARKSWLYEHMDFRDVREEFLEEMKETLKKSFQDEESFGFLNFSGDVL